MDILWSAGRALTANELRDALLDPARAGAKPLATTTVLTVLSRLEKKEFVSRDRDLRPHGYSAVSSKEAHTAALMHEVLGTTTDRTATLARFIGNVSPQEAQSLRALLENLGSSPE